MGSLICFSQNLTSDNGRSNKNTEEISSPSLCCALEMMLTVTPELPRWAEPIRAMLRSVEPGPLWQWSVHKAATGFVCGSLWTNAMWYWKGGGKESLHVGKRGCCANVDFTTCTPWGLENYLCMKVTIHLWHISSLLRCCICQRSFQRSQRHPGLLSASWP